MSAPSRSRTSAPTYIVELPVEIWEQVLTRLPKTDLWKLRSLNKVAYGVAARVYYGSIWVGPFQEKKLLAMLERVWYVKSLFVRDQAVGCSPKYSEPRFPIIGFVHTLNVHTNIDFGRPSGESSESKKAKADLHRFMKNRKELFKRMISNPNLRVDTLTIYFDNVILPYTHLIWQRVADSLVHLELQFVSQSVCDALLSLSGQVYCPKLRSFVLATGPGYRSPIFYSTAQKRSAGSRGWYASSRFSIPSSVLRQILKLLKAILPEGLLSLGILWSSYNSEDQPWILDPSFIHPTAFPSLQNLHISGLSMDINPHLSQFLLARASSLQSLALENVCDRTGLFGYIPMMQELEELRLDSVSYVQLFKPASFQSGRISLFVQRYSHLRRLEVHDWYPTADNIFMLLVELGRGRSCIQELKLTLRTIQFCHLRVALLLLPRVTELTFSGVGRCDPLMRQLSRHPLWIELESAYDRTVRFGGLAQSGLRLGPALRRAMTTQLRKDIDRIYHECISSLEGKDALYSSIKTALMSAESMARCTSRLDSPAEDHRKVTLALAEGCLLN